MDNSNVNIDLIRGHVDTIILKSLYYEDKYGYEILNEIKEKSKGMYTLKQPTLYSCLKRLEKQGYIRSYKGDTSNGAQRVYYSLQPAGRAFLESDQHQWEFSRTIIDSLLSSEEFDPEKHVAPFDPSSFRPLTRRSKSSDGDFDEEDGASVVTPTSESRDFAMPADDYVVPPETEAPPVDEYDDIPHEYIGTTYPTERTVTPAEGGYKPYSGEFNGERDYPGTPAKEETPMRNALRYDEDDRDDDAAASDDVEDVEEYDATPVSPATPVFYGDERTEEDKKESEDEPNRESDYYAKETYSAYVPADSREERANADKEEALGRLYERKPVQPAVEEKKPEPATYSTDVGDGYDEYSGRQTVNYIDTFDSIYSVPMTQVTPSSSSQVSGGDDEKINYLTTSELKSKMMAEGYNLRPYVKKNTSEYYINQYYFSNKLNRDSSVLTFIVYAIGVLIAYFSTAPKYGHNIGALLGFLALGALYPVVMFVAYCVDPKKRIKANFKAKNALINSLIVIVNAIILIVLIGFLACGARVDDINSMVRPVIIPMVFLLMIPIAIAIYYWLYKSNHYHVN